MLCQCLPLLWVCLRCLRAHLSISPCMLMNCLIRGRLVVPLSMEIRFSPTVSRIFTAFAWPYSVTYRTVSSYIRHFHCDLLCTDTLFALLIFDGYLWDYEIIIEILCPVSSLQRAGKWVSFCWVSDFVGLLSNETSSAASSCMTEWLAFPVPSSTACVAEQVLALRKCCDWISGN
jgi:hypothetical protein